MKISEVVIQSHAGPNAEVTDPGDLELLDITIDAAGQVRTRPYEYDTFTGNPPVIISRARLEELIRRANFNQGKVTHLREAIRGLDA